MTGEIKQIVQNLAVSHVDILNSLTKESIKAIDEIKRLGEENEVLKSKLAELPADTNDDKCWVVNEQYENDCGNLEEVNHVFFDFEKAKEKFEVLIDPDICENIVLQVGAEDPETGEIVGKGDPILHWNADETYEKEVADEYCNTDASYFVTTGDPWDV